MKSSFPAGLALASVFRLMPPYWRTGHVIADLDRCFRWEYNKGSTYSKAEAVGLAFRAVCEAVEGFGHGNRAARREAQAEAARLNAMDGSGALTEEDINKMEAFYAARRPDPKRVATMEEF